MPQALLLNTTTFCNARCPFCIVFDSLDKPELNMTDEQIEAALVRARADGATDVGYSGGEPSIDPRLLDVIRRAKELGFTRQSMNTNGIKLRDGKYCEALLAAGMTSIDFSVHGHLDELHDTLVAKKGALEAIRQACAHFRELAKTYRFDLSATVVIAKLNYPQLKEIMQFLRGLGISNIRLKYAYEGNMKREAIVEQVAPYGDVMPAIKETIDWLAAQRHGFGITHIPLCLLGEHAVFSQDLERRPAVMAFAQSSVTGDAGQFFRKDGDVCATCSVANLCTRLDAGYEEFHGRPALVPFADAAAVEALFDRAEKQFPGSTTRIKRIRETYRANRDAAPVVTESGAPAVAHPGTAVKLTIKRNKAVDA